MEETCVLRPIAHVHSEFPGKFGIPRQSGVVPELRSELIFTPEFPQSGRAARHRGL